MSPGRPAFPTSILDFQSRFATDTACYEFLRQSRWPDGFKCPKCDNGTAYDRADRWGVECAKCGRCTSVTAGTVMHKTHTPIRVWMWAAWLMVTSKRGVSALELQRQLGLKTYATAFQMLHKLRAAMVAPDRSKLRGVVEVDESYIGGVEKGKPGRGAVTKSLIVGAVECRDGKPGRLRLRVIDAPTTAELHRFIYESTDDGTTIQTDGSPSYPGLEDRTHVVQMAGREGLTQDDVLPCYHLAISNLKALLLGTHHGAVKAKHLQSYLNEFAFRFNRRNNLQAAFQTLLGLSSKSVGPTYRSLHDGDFDHPGQGEFQRKLPL